ncbi:inositol-pentakisphosphate 2-kinase [Desarmillaria tabescens]|uniref:Inositol-pentakisphosphate 2-kinase n=1 Tax=Armillaria tabescens TaxID=1929756 RepID=A0AA39NDG7_ARMTA|nr:inositol-pentakisphosphate 2-kinase [Desarmillaria tabescens]KAK0463636.1 inositol-pentakisphosphate 2-kinase [Desarmillaria tabescens]
MAVSISSVTATLPSHWKYVSEGGATIVFSYVGPPNLSFDGMVLRLRKSGVQTPVLEKQAFGTVAEEEEPDDSSIVFQETCMKRLIPSVHLPKLQSVPVDKAWLEELSRLHEPDRPLQRTVSGGIDTMKGKAVLATDLVGGSGLAIEIKPKWSFLPNKTYLSAANYSIKATTCRFCMHSHMRSRDGETVSLGYCPLDLFSSNRGRMKQAVYSLYDNWLQSDGTVNNLKIFVKGTKIGVDQRFSMFSSEAYEESDENVRETFSEAILALLVGTPVLRILNKLQRTLDSLDIEGLSLLWREAQGPANPPQSTNGYTPLGRAIGVGGPNPSLADWSAFIDEYLTRPPNLEDLRYHLLAYLLSATFKDCSIMIRMDLLDPRRPQGEVDPSKVTVIDLDPKSMARLAKWEKLDEIIVREYSAVPVADRKTCLDDWVDEV